MWVAPIQIRYNNFVKGIVPPNVLYLLPLMQFQNYDFLSLQAFRTFCGIKKKLAIIISLRFLLFIQCKVMVTNIILNISVCVLQKKESHTHMKRLWEEKVMTDFSLLGEPSL